MLPEKFVVKIQNHEQEAEVASELKKFEFGPYKCVPFSPFVYWDKEYAGECLKSEIHNSIRKGVESWPVYTYEEWKELYYKKDFVLPEKWCIISRNREQDNVINSFARSLAGGEHWTDLANYAKRYFLCINKGKYRWGKTYKEDHVEITFEQFKEYVIGQKMYTVEECREKNIAVYFKTLEEANMLAKESGHNKHWGLVGIKDINCLRFTKSYACPTWTTGDGAYFKKNNSVTQFINFEQVKFKKTMGNKFGIRVENDNAREIVEFLTLQGVKHDWTGTGNGTNIYYVDNNEMQECTSRILNGYTLYTLEEYRQALGGKIIGYKLKKEWEHYKQAVNKIVGVSSFNFNDFEKEACNFTLAIKDLKDAAVLDLWFTPVFEKVIKSKEISLGTPARKFTVFKNNVQVLAGDGDTYTFTPDEIAVIEKKFAKFEWHGVNCNVTSINIGCAAGLEITKETIDTIKEIQSTL